MDAQPNPPQWAFWRHAAKAMVWEAVSLSLGIEPRTLQIYPEARGYRLLGIPDELLIEFEGRMNLARRNLGVAFTVDQHQCERGSSAEILLSQFRIWAMSLGLNVPSEFEASWPDATPKPERQKPGPKRKVRDGIANKMYDDLVSGRRTIEELERDKLTALVAAYGGSLNTDGLARKEAIAKFSEFQKSNSEKP
jgi:hypothetical protein